MFNYHEFYTEMVLQVSPATRVDAGYDYPVDAGQLVNNHSPAPVRHHDSPPVPSGQVFSANSEMIAQQKSLIEDQRRIMSEQARLIDEKTRLIAEKNELLQRQSELIDN